MVDNILLNPAILDDASIQSFRERFWSAGPVKFIVIDDFLTKEIAAGIYRHFPPIQQMKVNYSGLNEQKSEDSDFDKLHHVFNDLHQSLSSQQFINWIEKITDVKSLSTINDRLGFGLHQGMNNSFLDIHIDYNLHPIKKLYRKLNLIIFFNPDWQSEWGGNLEFWDKHVKNKLESIIPVFNRCVIFECSDISYHGYNKINVLPEITRKSYYQYYFIPATERISFHDTIFRSRPDEPIVKKLLTTLKEYSKNHIKRLLLKLGWHWK